MQPLEIIKKVSCYRMKRFLVYLFCFSIILQSIIGQFMFIDNSTDTFYTSIPSLLSGKKRTDVLSHTASLAKPEHNCSDNTNNANANLPKFVRDSFAEHLFSPSNCPEAGLTLIFFSCLFLGHCFDLFAIEEKINNIVHFYSSFFKNIQIGLPSTKIIYPYHNFY